ncbi:MAG: hypothetical protein JO149_07250, partial [Gammaproteobacteria bacterium]|nr:hypothetical protein [Gammaproteobacteria bacterium]
KPPRPNHEETVKQYLSFLSGLQKKPINDSMPELADDYEKLLSLLNEHKDSELEVSTNHLQPFCDLFSNRFVDLKKNYPLHYQRILSSRSLTNQAYEIIAEKISAMLNRLATSKHEKILMPAVEEETNSPPRMRFN